MARLTIPFDKGADAMTFRDFARDYLKQLNQWGYSDETGERYDRIYMQFLAYVKSVGGHDDLRSFNDETVYGFAQYLGKRGVRENTIINILSGLASLAKYGMMTRDDKGRRRMREDPTKSFRWPTAQHRETQYPSGEDLRKLVDLPAPIHKAMVRDLLIETGVRVSEAVRLNVEHLRDAQGRYYLAVKRKGRGQRHRAETRDVPLSKALGDALRDWLLLRDRKTKPEDPLLITQDGERWSRNSIANMIARLAEDAGVTRMRVSPHKLRHAANIVARLAGVDAATRARKFGHSSLRSQERYDHVLPHEMHDAHERQLDELQRYLGGPFRHGPEVTGADRNDQTEKANDDEEKRIRGS